MKIKDDGFIKKIDDLDCGSIFKMAWNGSGYFLMTDQEREKDDATQIAERMNSHNDGYEYGVISVDEWKAILDFQAKANSISFEIVKTKGE